MQENEIGRIIYLLLLGIAVGGWFVAQNRNSFGKVAQMAMIWGLIFVGVVAGFGLWGDIRDDVAPRALVAANGVIEVPRQSDGHYYLTLDVNDTPVTFVVDTGASSVVLTQQDAARVGIDPQSLVFSGSANTANGVVRTARVRVDTITLGEFSDRNMAVYVNEGALEDSLLGMSYLQRFDKIEIAKNKLILTR